MFEQLVYIAFGMLILYIASKIYCFGHDKEYQKFKKRYGKYGKKR